MRAIQKKILTDENMQPVAVQIDYPDWLWLETWMNGQAATEPAFGVGPPVAAAPDLNRFAGTLRLGQDPLAYQHRARPHDDRHR